MVDDLKPSPVGLSRAELSMAEHSETVTFSFSVTTSETTGL